MRDHILSVEAFPLHAHNRKNTQYTPDELLEIWCIYLNRKAKYLYDIELREKGEGGRIYYIVNANDHTVVYGSITADMRVMK